MCACPFPEPEQPNPSWSSQGMIPKRCNAYAKIADVMKPVAASWLPLKGGGIWYGQHMALGLMVQAYSDDFSILFFPNLGMAIDN